MEKPAENLPKKPFIPFNKASFKEKVPPFFSKVFSYKLPLLLALGSIIVIIAVLYISQEKPGEKVVLRTSGVELKALSEDSLGVAKESKFLLTSKDPIGTTAIEQSLNIEPKRDFKIDKRTDTEYEISFKEPLAEGEIYQFKLAVAGSSSEQASGTAELFKDLSWAFQIKDPFRIISSLPRNEGVRVPINSGVEVNFNTDQYIDINNFFSISPQVNGTFERHKKTAVFAPVGGLQPETIYTVTVSKDLGVQNSTETLGEDYTFAFETDVSSGKQETIEFKRLMYEYPPSLTPALDIYTDAGQVSVKVYKYASLQTFIKALQDYAEIPYWSYYAQKNYSENTSDLSPILDFTAPVENLSYNLGYFSFPEAVPNGFYLVEAEVADRKGQTWLQITELASYLTTSQTKTLIWVNDLQTKSAVAGAEVKLVGENLDAQYTNGEGVAYFDSPETLKSEDLHFVTIQTDTNKQAVVPITTNSTGDYRYRYVDYFDRERAQIDEYWSYMYLDRPLYKPSDTVNYWGFLQHRERGSIGSNVEIVLVDDYTLNPEAENINILDRQEVKLLSNNTYQGSFAIKNLSPTYYYLLLLVDGKTVDYESFSVQTYTKPAYKISVEPRQRGVYAGEEAAFLGETSFYEGTPVPNVSLSYSNFSSGQVTSDASGKFTINVPTEYSEYYISSERSFQYYPQQNHVEVTPTLAEEGEIIGGAHITVFGSNIDLSTQTKKNGSTGTIIATVKHIDLEGFNNGNDEYLGEPVPNLEVRGEVFEYYWNKIEDGQYYDFINKVIRPTYHYDRVEKLLNNFSITTNNSGQAEYTFNMDPGKFYQVNLQATGSNNRNAHASVYVYGVAGSYPQNSNYYHLESQKSAEESYNPNLAFTYKENEQVQLKLMRGDEELPSGNINKYLYTLAQRGLKDYQVKDSPTLEFKYNSQYIPNLQAKAIYFDGFTYHESYVRDLYFDKNERKLNVEISYGKEYYQPGEEAEIKVKITDQQGRGKESAVNINLVDEALYDLVDQHTDLLTSLYRHLQAGVYIAYSSHQYPVPGDEAEGGGGGGGRELFVDTAFFGSIETDSSGNGSVKFKLPDNLTSWRITAQGISTDLFAGHATKTLYVKKPVFADTVINSTYLLADKPVIKLRAFGELLSSNDSVEFTINSESLGIKDSKLTGKAFEPISFSLPELKLGEHKLSIKVKAKGKEDTLIRSFTVLNSYLTKNESFFTELRENVEIKGSETDPTTLLFSDNNRGRFFSPLSSLAYAYGDRADQKIARIKSRKLLKEYFDTQVPGNEDFIPNLYQTPQGGISLFPYSDAELEMSAKLAAMGADYFDTNTLADYFYSIVNDYKESRERTIIAVYGLAALGEPVLVPINNMSQISELSPLEKLYLGLASVELGHMEQGRILLKEVLETNGEVYKPGVRVKVGKDQDDILQATALAANLAVMLNEYPQEELHNYMQNNYAKDILFYADELTYTEQMLPRLSSESVKFNYSLSGKNESVELKKGESFRLTLYPEDLKNITFSNISGKVGVGSYYLMPMSVNTIDFDNNISVGRRYTVNGSAVNTFSESDLIKVELNYSLGSQALSGCYQISDYLPSGLKVVTEPYSRVAYHADDDIWYPYEINGQKVSFCVGSYTSKPPAYYARVISKGEYTSEPVIIQSLQSTDSINLSESSSVSIN